MDKTPRGIANCNPGNIRKGQQWVGMRPLQTDPAFVQFITPDYGIRAMVKILMNYERIGLHTIRQAIERWAPQSENNTSAYIAAVCKECSVGPNDEVSYRNIMPLLIHAIIWHENGCCPYDDATLARGIEMATEDQ
jgi:hypothetical protein